MPPRNLDKSADVVEELYDADEAVREQFMNAVSAEAVKFAEVFAPLFAMFVNFEKDCQGSTQRALVAALMHGVLDDLLTSVKLMLSGKLGPSGNLARQAAEGICMAIMCASPAQLAFRTDKANYWELLAGRDERAEGNKAPHQLLKNSEVLGLDKTGAEQLQRTLETHHPHSHAGVLAMANRMDLGAPGMIHFGGHFDESKVDAYKKELAQRLSLCAWAREAMTNLWSQVKDLPKDTAPS